MEGNLKSESSEIFGTIEDLALNDIESALLKIKADGLVSDLIENQEVAREVVKTLKKTHGIEYQTISKYCFVNNGNMSTWRCHPPKFESSLGRQVVNKLQAALTSGIIKEENRVLKKTSDEYISMHNLPFAYLEYDTDVDEDEVSSSEDELFDDENRESEPDQFLSEERKEFVKKLKKRLDREEGGYIYLMRDKPQRFKIGASRKPISRAAQLGVGNVDIELLHYVKVSAHYVKVEQRVHRYLRSLDDGLFKHKKGEWYTIDNSGTVHANEIEENAKKGLHAALAHVLDKQNPGTEDELVVEMSKLKLTLKKE